MAKMVGLSRPLKTTWLNKVVELQLSGKSEAEIKNELNEYLAFEIGSAINIRKTREILLNLWVRENEENKEIRVLALKTYKNTESVNNRLALHWCMIMLSYPIFNDVNGLIGKIITMQDTFTSAWLREKIYEVWGERATLLHSLPKIMQTLTNINVVEKVKLGVYQVKQYPVLDKETIKVLVLTILATGNNAYYEVPRLSTIPQMYPFVFDVSNEWIFGSGNFELARFGGKTVIVK